MIKFNEKLRTFFFDKLLNFLQDFSGSRTDLVGNYGGDTDCVHGLMQQCLSGVLKSLPSGFSKINVLHLFQSI